MAIFRNVLVGDDIRTEKRFLFLFWRPYALASSSYNKALKDAANTVQKLRGQLAKIKAERESYEALRADLKKGKFNRMGEGEPYSLSRKEAEKKFAAYTEAPDPGWMQALHPLFLGEYRVSATFTTSTGGGYNPSPRKSSPGPEGKRTGFTLPGMEDISLHLGAEHQVDTVLGFKDEQKKGGASDGKDKNAIRERLKKENPRMDGESDKDFGKRISDMVNIEVNKKPE